LKVFFCFNKDAQSIAICLIFTACYSKFPDGAKCIPKVSSAICGSTLRISTRLLFISLAKSLPGQSLISLYVQFPPIHSNAIRYHNIFSGTKAPPVTFSPASQVSTDFCQGLSSVELIALVLDQNHQQRHNLRSIFESLILGW